MVPKKKEQPLSSPRRTSRRKETEAHAQQTAVAKLQLIQKKHAYMRSGCVELRTQAAGEQKKAVAAHRGRDMGR